MVLVDIYIDCNLCVMCVLFACVQLFTQPISIGNEATGNQMTIIDSILLLLYMIYIKNKYQHAE